MADRVTTVGQSFFDPLPTGGDVYLLKSVLADWPDREALTILERCAEAARPSGRVVLVSGVSPDNDGGPSPALLMMVLVGGRERHAGGVSSAGRISWPRGGRGGTSTVGPLHRRVPSVAVMRYTLFDD